MKKIFGVLIIIVGILGGLYVGGWVLCIDPIIEACRHFDAGTLNATIIGWTIVKCMFASPVGIIMGYLGIFVGGLLMVDID